MSPPTLKLNDGEKIPRIAFGTGSALFGRDSSDSVQRAINSGFDHIDTAQVYKNEASVGKGIQQSGLKRAELYVTTKYVSNGSPFEALEDSLKKLRLSYVDLYLVHFPRELKDFDKDWRSFELAKEKGLARSIGVSNFTVEDLKRLEHAKIKPAVNQIRLHPYNIAEQAPVLDYAAKNDIVIEAYGSLYPITKRPGGPVDTVVGKLAEVRNATPAQIIFLWVLGKGAVIVTTSSKKERLQEYIGTFDLAPLTALEIAAIDAAGRLPEESQVAITSDLELFPRDIEKGAHHEAVVRVDVRGQIAKRAFITQATLVFALATLLFLVSRGFF